MASFVDMIPQFNPYVSEIPVEAMVKVGMEKQQRYDQGIQKIQAEINQIGGLDIARDIDKAYLQSKINDLGNNLKTFMASDFSDSQLVNSVSGMTAKVIKDPIVQSAVSSTAFYKKQVAEMEKALAEGKASQANVYDFNEKAAAWMNSTNLKQSFRDRYVPYTDVRKKAMEAIKSLHPKLQQVDIPYVVKADGTIDTSRIADAMTRNKIEGISEDQIKQAIFASMDPNDLNQLYIDAKYQFRGYGPEQLVNKAKQNYDSQRASAIENLQYLNIQKRITSDAVALDNINAQIDQYKRALGMDGKTGSLDEQFYQNVELARTNPNDVKYSIYKDAFVKEFANGFSWKNEVKEIMKNPLKEQENWRAEMKFKQEQENRQRYEFQANYALKVEELGLKKMELALKQAELNPKDPSTAWTPLGSETDNDLQAEEIYQAHLNGIQENLDSQIGVLNAKGYDNAEIEVAYKKWTDAQGDPKKSGLDARLVEAMPKIAKLKNELSSYKRLEDSLYKEAEREAGLHEKNQRVASEYKPQSIRVRQNGPVYNFNFEEARQLLNAPVVKVPFQGYKIDTSKLNPQQRAFVNEVEKQGMKVSDYLGNVTQSVKAMKNNSKEVEDLFKVKLSKVATELVPQIKAVPRDPKKGVIPQLVSTNLSQLASTKAYQGVSPKIISQYLSNENIKDTDVFVYNQGNNYEIWLKNRNLDPKEKDIQKIKVTPNDISRIFNSDAYISKYSDISKRISIGKGNTNPTGMPEDSMFQRRFGDFPAIKKLQVTADLLPGMEEDQFFYGINVKKKDGRYMHFQFAGEDGTARVGFDQGLQSLKKLTDEQILAKIKEQYPNFDISQLEY